ncbi:MAG: hypothetical protein K2Q06_16010 [Parvularculaceae bacterium]|nr:hypothetical protein [Parvularculaceae bacterium]
MNTFKSFFAIIVGVSALALHSAAVAGPPGAGDRVYSPEVEKGVAELEFRGARLTGGPDGGEGVYVYEGAYGVTTWWKTGLVLETENEPNGPLKIESVELENVFALPRIPGVPVDVGIYAEYEATTRGADSAKLRWLAAFDAGPVETKLNFNVEKTFSASDPWEFGYGFLSAVEIFDDVELGVEGFGGLGDARDFGGLSRREHYIGPVALFEIERDWLPGEIDIEAGYLFGVGGAEAEGQARLLLEWEFKL